MNLNAQSSLELHYTESERTVRLLTGEVLFNVEKDPYRPFRVLTERAVVRAVGASFNVRQRQFDYSIIIGSINSQQPGYTLFSPPSCATNGVHLSRRLDSRRSSWGFARRAAPPQTLKAREIPIESNPFTATLDRQSSKICVRYQVAPDFCVPIESRKYLPMPGAWADWNTVGLAPDHVRERKRLVRRAGEGENARMGDDAEESAQRQIGYGECLVPGKHGLKPRPARSVFLGVVTIRRNKYVYVRQDHCPSS